MIAVPKHIPFYPQDYVKYIISNFFLHHKLDELANQSSPTHMRDSVEVKQHNLNFLELTEENIKPYGNIFHNLENEKIRLARWPNENGFRKVEDGISGGTTSGKFEIKWINDILFVENSGVEDGKYQFAHKKNNSIFITNEINRHACGSQYFFSYEIDFIVMIGIVANDKHPDFIKFDDFVCFKVPKNSGIHINTNVWHSPPLTFKENGFIYTAQSKVHSKIYYDPIEEHNVVLKIDCAK